ncbi:MAG: DNA mismatch repair protein MutS [Crocinitomicaceae bacterium]|nr:MAG: DNA mismatch repair protein MutS [Crocinitomicaceae bacterium]
MNFFDEQTLHDLEFTTIQSWLEELGIGPTAKERLRTLKPSSHFDSLKLELTKLKEFHTIRVEGESFPGLDFDELKKELKYLPIKNAVLEQEGFVRISRASELVNALVYFFDKREKDYPTLYELLSEVYYTKEIIEAIEKVFDRRGNIKDDASPELYAIRQKINAVRNQINRNFEKEMRKLLKEGVLGDTKETFVNDRRVLTIVSTHKRKIKGSVVGSSKTGSLTYIEPEVNVGLNNELELLTDDERKEIFRILQQLTASIAHHFPLIQGYQNLLTELDFINAKAKLAIDLNADLPSISAEPHIELIEAFHPILWKNNRAAGKKTLPQNLIMDKFSRMLVISGPNAGGKSITLKTIGLAQLMLQAGLLVPMNPNSKMCFFQSILTDIGDNQSIENELSTYSYRLKRMKHFLEVANRRTLLLLDEFGTGSDPDLGGALADVFFEQLYNKKCFGVITTHYGNIKLKADRLKNAINGCMLFNTETLEPLYRFSIGQPGSSFTFEVAQINGIPLELIEEAKTKIDEHKVNMDKLLSELQREKTYLEKLNHEHIEAQRLAEEARVSYLEKKKRFDEKLAQQQIAIERDNKYVNSGKKLKSFIDRYQTKARKKDANQPLMEEIKKYLAVERGKIEQTKLAEKLKAEVNAKNPKKVKPTKREVDLYQRDKIVLGSVVKLIETKQSGTVEEVSGNQLTVTFGFMRLKVEREKLMWIK